MFSKFFAAIAAILVGTASCDTGVYYVAGNGTGSTCSAAAPCDTISTALRLTNADDTIVCLSTPQSDAIVITKSITIDCSSTRAPLRDVSPLVGSGIASVNVYINATGTYTNVNNQSATDARRTVRLRGLTIDGTAGNPTPMTQGIDIRSAAAVFVEDCAIQNTSQQGIYDRRTGGQTRLYVKDTVIRGIAGPGIVAASQGTAATVLDNVSLLNNTYGIAAATGNNVMISRSTIAGNSLAGVHADGGAQIAVTGSTISYNTAHVNAYGKVRLRDNDLQFGNVAIQGSNAVSMGENRFAGNGSIGTAPTAAAGAPTDITN